MKQRDTLNLPVLVDCMPNEQPPPSGQMTWGHPAVPGLPVRIFRRADIDRHVAQLPAGQREHYLSLLKLMSACAHQDWSAVRRARELFDHASATILGENRKLAAEIKEWAQDGNVQLPTQSGHIIRFEPHALLDLADDLERADSPPMPEDANPDLLLSAQVSHVLRGTKLVLWHQHGRSIPALYCASDFFLAAVTFTLMGEWVGWEMCINCGKFFRQTRGDKKWCSDDCGNKYRVRKSRAKTRAKRLPSRGC